jgi:hypothetical protein
MKREEKRRKEKKSGEATVGRLAKAGKGGQITLCLIIRLFKPLNAGPRRRGIFTARERE